MTFQPCGPEHDLELKAVFDQYPGADPGPARRLVALRREFYKLCERLEGATPGDAARPILSRLLETQTQALRAESMLAHSVETRAREKAAKVEGPEPPAPPPGLSRFEAELLRRLDRIDRRLSEPDPPAPPPSISRFDAEVIRRIVRLDVQMSELLEANQPSVLDLKAEVSRLAELADQLRDARLSVAAGADAPDPDLENRMRAVWDAKEKTQ